MNPLTALEHQPPALHSIQLLLVGVFLTSYLAAVTSLLEPRGRMRAAGIALAAGIGMGFAFSPWTLGALLAALSVGAVGVFIGVSWVLSRALGVHEQTSTLLPDFEGDESAEEAMQPQRPRVQAQVATVRFAAPTAPAPLS
jgi:MFS family permease